MGEFLEISGYIFDDLLNQEEVDNSVVNLLTIDDQYSKEDVKEMRGSYVKQNVQ